MAIRFVSVKCPECGAALDIEEGRKQIFCSYCGSKVIIENENEHIYRNIDEARIRQAETDRQVQLKKMEIIERKRAAAEKAKKTRLQLTVILVIVTLIFLGIGFGTDNLGLSMPGLVGIYILMFMWISSRDDKEDDDLDFGDKVRVPAAISDYENKSYAVIEAMFTNAGFHNIQCIPLNDLTMGLLKKPGMVESITINGRSVTSGGKKYSPDAAVVISYHSYRQGGMRS